MMHKTSCSFGMTLLSVACMAFFVCAGTAFAQAKPAAKPASSKMALRIKEMPKLGAACLVASPEIDGRVKSPGRAVHNKRWAMFEVQYETAPEWIDEATFTFYLMCQDSKTKELHYFQTAVSYLDIAKGAHGAAVLLPPNAVARYGEPIAFGVEVMVEGEKVAADACGKAQGPWWNTLEKLGDKVKRHVGYLQDRSKTPFGVLYVDEYEAVR